MITTEETSKVYEYEHHRLNHQKIKDNETALEEFEKETQSNEAEDTKNIIMNFPTVYIHNWPETGKYDVYVGESNNIFARTRQHYQNKINHKTWQYRIP